MSVSALTGQLDTPVCVNKENKTGLDSELVLCYSLFVGLLFVCLTLNITCINLIIMTYAAIDHWPLKDCLRTGH